MEAIRQKRAEKSGREAFVVQGSYDGETHLEMTCTDGGLCWFLERPGPGPQISDFGEFSVVVHFTELRRLAGMAQQRSFEVTRAGNGIRDETQRIIHAAGVCVDLRERPSNIIHAAGVRGDFTSSAPKAGNTLRSQEKLPGGAAI